MPPAVIADRRLCLTADRSRVVEAADPAAAFLFAPEGGEITSAEVERYGLGVQEGRIVLPGETRSVSAEPERPPEERSGKKREPKI